MRNPEEAASASGRLRSSAMFDAEPDEEGIVANVPRRIASRKPTKQKTQSEINSEYSTEWIVWMSRRKLRETKQQPSL